MSKGIYLYPSNQGNYFKRGWEGKTYKIHFTGRDDEDSDPFILQALNKVGIDIDDIIMELVQEYNDPGIIKMFEELKKEKGSINFSNTFWRKILKGMMSEAKKGAINSKTGKVEEMPILSLYINDRQGDKKE